jgi:hypothetical protein
VVIHPARRNPRVRVKVSHHASARGERGHARLLGVITAVLIMRFCSVHGGFTIGYALETAVRGLPTGDATAVQTRRQA